MRYTFLLFSLFWTLFAPAQPAFHFNHFDINKGPANSDPLRFTVMGNKMFFCATDSIYGAELWVSDGTDTGTHKVKDINPGKEDGDPIFLGVMNNKIFFSAYEDGHGRELWLTDGTETGTKMIKEIFPDGLSSVNDHGIVYKNKLLFAADDGINGSELWISDGTDTGTHMLVEIATETQEHSQPCYFQHYNGKVLFLATQDIGYEYFITDGTKNGTMPFSDYSGILIPSESSIFHTSTNIFYQSYSTVEEGYTANSVWLAPKRLQTLIDLYPGPDEIDQVYFTQYKGKIYFLTCSKKRGHKLFVTNGWASGTSLVKTLDTGTVPFARSPLFTEYRGKLYFIRNTASGENEMWVTNGTEAGTKPFSDIAPGITDPRRLILFKDFLYFTANINSGDRQLIRTDGTARGTMLVSPPSSGVNPVPIYSDLIVCDSTLFYTADYYGDGIELWALQDTGYYPKFYDSQTSTRPADDDKLLGICNSEKETFNVYPNPNDGDFYIEPGRKDFNVGVVHVYDVTGRKMLSESITPGTVNKLITLYGIPKGIYFVQLRLDDTVQTRSITIQ